LTAKLNNAQAMDLTSLPGSSKKTELTQSLVLKHTIMTYSIL